MKYLKRILFNSCYLIMLIVALTTFSSCEDVSDEPPLLDMQNYFTIEGIDVKRDIYGTYRGEISSDSISFTVSKKRSSAGVIEIMINNEEQVPDDSIKVAGTISKPFFKYYIYKKDWGEVYYTGDEKRTITNIKINKNETGDSRELYFKLYGDQGFDFSDPQPGSIAIKQLPK